MNNSEINRILEQARQAYEPTDINRDRVRRAVGVALGLSAAAAAVSTATATTTTAAAAAAKGWVAALKGSLIYKSLIGLCAVTVAAGGTALVWNAQKAAPRAQVSKEVRSENLSRRQVGRSDDAAMDRQIQLPPPVEETQATVPEISQENIPVEIQQPKTRVHRQLVVKTVEKDETPDEDASNHRALDPEIQAEMELIRSANRSLHENQAAQALSYLQQHEERFPNGFLRMEQRGLKVLALCSVGRVQEGIAAKRAFLSDYPDAPLSIQVEKSCNGQ